MVRWKYSEYSHDGSFIIRAPLRLLKSKWTVSVSVSVSVPPHQRKRRPVRRDTVSADTRLSTPTDISVTRSRDVC